VKGFFGPANCGILFVPISDPTDIGWPFQRDLDLMSLLDRLRPKWQSADSEVRAEAVRQLDKSEVELLTAVAQQDADPRVRRIAVKKLDSPRLLLELADEEADGPLREFIRKRARQMLVQISCDGRDLEESKRALALLTDAADRIAVVDRARFPELRALAFDSLSDDAALAELVKRVKDPELRSRALERIQSPPALKKVVLDDASGDLALAALSRIEDPEILEFIFDQHTLPRTIRRQAFGKLEKIVPADHPIKAKARQERFLELAQRAEALAEARTPAATTELNELSREWAEVETEGPADSRAQERFRSAVERMSTLPTAGPGIETAETAEAAQASVAPESGAPESATAGRDAVEAPEGSLDSSTPEAPTELTSRRIEIIGHIDTLQGEAIAVALEQAMTRWQALASEDGAGTSGRLDPGGVELEERFARAAEAAEARLETWREQESRRKGAEELVARAEALAVEPDLPAASREYRAVEKEWSRFRAEADETLAHRFRGAHERLKGRESEARREREKLEQATLALLEARIERMENLASVTDFSIKDADRELREAQDFLKEMGPLPKSANRKKARRRLVEAREKLFKRTQDIRELEEWKRWANVDVQQSLIDRIEKLRESNDLPKVAKELRLIHEDWKKAGATTPDRADELWQRYKAIRDEIKARCDRFFEKQTEERGENLVKKEALCAQVEALKDSEDWNGTAAAIKDLQAEWKKIGPVPQESSEPIWKRFRAACDHFFARRKESFDHLKSERDENLAKKEALVAAAEAMQRSTDWHTTANELKRLQSEWRTIGAVPRKKSDEIWQRFRGACDTFFDRYKRRDEVESEERSNKREALIEELSSLTVSGDGEGRKAAERAHAIWTDWKKLGPVPPDSSSLLDRFESALGAVVLASPEAFAGGDLDPALTGKKRAKLCERAEAIVAELDETAPLSEPLENLAQRLKDALASNTMTGGKHRAPKLDWSAASDEIARLRGNWNRIAPVPGETGQSLAERFESACRRFFELRPAARTGSGRASEARSSQSAR
jgi:Domain of Unknown Function (DUF349)